MPFLTSLKRGYERAFACLDRVTEGWLLPSLARFVFAAVLFFFFWNSAMTKVGSGVFGIVSPSLGAYYQILPGAMQAAGGQIANLSLGDQLIVLFATWAEILLPILIVLGLFTRLAALGMLVFIAVMTYVDMSMTGLQPEVIGSLFDGRVDGKWDHNLLWALVVLVPLLKGPGPVSLDRLLGWLLRRRAGRPRLVESAPRVETPPAPGSV